MTMEPKKCILLYRMQTLTILQDTREQVPLLFPSTLSIGGRRYRIHVKKKKLDAGDYALEGTNTAIIERKASIRELFKNLVTDDKRRTKKAFDRLCKATSNPILLLEGSPGDLLADKNVYNSGAVLQKLLDECAERGISIIFVGKCRYPARRRQVGELVIRTLAAYKRKHKNGASS